MKDSRHKKAQVKKAFSIEINVKELPQKVFQTMYVA